jgi:hypothetical protein
MRVWLTVSANALLLGTMFLTVASRYLTAVLPSVGGNPPGAILRDAGCVALVLLAGLVVILRVESRRDAAAPASVLAVPVLLYASWVAIMVAFAPERVAAILAVRNLTLYLLLPVALHALWRRGFVRARLALTTFLLLAGVVAILGLLDTLSGGATVAAFGVVRYPELMFGGIVRASGGISDSLVVAYLMGWAIIVAVWWSGSIRRLSGSRLYVGLCLSVGVLCTITLIWSLTRGAWIATGVGIALFLLASRSRWAVGATAAVLLVGIACTALTANSVPLVAHPARVVTGGDTTPEPSNTGQDSHGATAGGGTSQAVIDRLGSSDVASQESASLRLSQLLVTIQMLADNPLGTGLGTEGGAADRVRPAATRSTLDIYAMMVGLQTGVPGLILWAAVMVMVFVWWLRHRRLVVAPLVTAGLGVVGVSAWLSHTLDAPPFSVFLWLTVLCLGAEAVVESQTAHASEPGA